MLKKISILLVLILPLVLVQQVDPASAGNLSVYNCAHSPSPVEPGDTVTITCTVIESQMLEYLVRVYYRVNGGSFSSAIMSGASPTYSASIGSFASGDFVEYYVTAIGEDINFGLISDRDPSTGFKSFRAELSSEISWISPANGATIHYEGDSNPFTFTFGWSYNRLEDARLKLGDYSIDILEAGTKTTSVSINYAANIDGTVTAQLIGYYGGNPVVSDSRTFIFEWVRYVDQFLEESGNQVIGDKLYLIIHDPSGDESFTNFVQPQTITMTAGIETTGSVSVTTEAGGSLFGIGGDASVGVTLEAIAGSEFNYSMSVGPTLSSSQITDDPDFMGPGRGDYYWGESWLLNWQLVSTRTVYWNSNEEYADPVLLYGIIRDSEAFIGDQEASIEWKNLNPVWNGYTDVSWIDSKTVTGGASFSEIATFKSTFSLSSFLTVAISDDTKLKFAFASNVVELSLTTSLSSSVGSENEQILGFTINDDDSTDIIMQDVGIDEQFGTFIFRINPDSTTSNPLEFGTKDYNAPVIDFPIISLDSDGFAPSPSQDDSPLVTVSIMDEGGVFEAIAWYSTNGGISYERENMSEQIENPGTWWVRLPNQPHGTTVNWYIEARDNSNNAAVRKDVDNNDFEYSVINRNPVVDVISPNGGETLSKQVIITWSGSDPDYDSLTYSLEYNFDNQGWTILAVGLVNSSLEWDISEFPDSDNVLIKVIVNDGSGGFVEDISDFVFSIDNIDIPLVAVSTPLSGLTYSGSFTINWALNDPDDLTTSFDLYYSPNSGVDWFLIKSSLFKSSRDFDWNSSVVVYSSAVRVKVIAYYQVDLESRLSDDISDIFLIDNRPELEVNLIYPDGSELIYDFATIAWTVLTHPDVVYSTDLEYSSDGENWIPIANNLEGTTYDWITNDLEYSTTYRIRVTVSGQYLGYSLENVVDVSEGSFTIDPDHEAPILSSPEDLNFENNTVGHTLSWTINDENPFNYSILLDGSYLISDQSWSNGDEITIGVDGLPLGTHEFILIAEDTWGHLSSDVVLVTIIFTPPPPPSFDVRVNSPNGGEVIVTSPLQITWQIDNPNLLIIDIDIYYSSDYGTTWNLIVENVAGNNYYWDISELANGPGYYIKVVGKTNYSGEVLITEDLSDNACTILNDADTSSLSSIIPGTPGFTGVTLLIALFASLLLMLFRRKKK